MHVSPTRQQVRAQPGGRDKSRRNPNYQGTTPRYEPVRNDYCPVDFRQLPCGRTHAA